MNQCSAFCNVKQKHKPNDVQSLSLPVKQLIRFSVLFFTKMWVYTGNLWDKDAMYRLLWVFCISCSWKQQEIHLYSYHSTLFWKREFIFIQILICDMACIYRLSFCCSNGTQTAHHSSRYLHLHDLGRHRAEKQNNLCCVSAECES